MPEDESDGMGQQEARFFCLTAGAALVFVASVIWLLRP